MGLSRKIIIQGVASHNELSGRNNLDAHPESAITGLSGSLSALSTDVASVVSTATNAESIAVTANSRAGSAEALAESANVKIGVLTDLQTSNKATVVAAVNTVKSESDGYSSRLTSIEGQLGTIGTQTDIDRVRIRGYMGT